MDVRERQENCPRYQLTGKGVFSVAVIMRCLLMLMAPGSVVFPAIDELAIVGARKLPSAIGIGEHLVLGPLGEFEPPHPVDNRGHLRHNRGALVDEHELLEQDSLQEGLAGQSEGANSLLVLGGNNPGAEPLDVKDRHRATTAHAEDKDDRSVGGSNRAPAVVDRDLGLGDHLELSRGETELQVVTSVEDGNGVDDMVAVPDESFQVVLNEFPDGDLLLDLNAVRAIAEAVEGAELGQALDAWKRRSAEKK